MSFESPKARDEYLPHPIHEEVKGIVGGRTWGQAVPWFRV
jgi:hypothetical protein